MICTLGPPKNWHECAINGKNEVEFDLLCQKNDLKMVEMTTKVGKRDRRRNQKEKNQRSLASLKH